MMKTVLQITFFFMCALVYSQSKSLQLSQEFLKTCKYNENSDSALNQLKDLNFNDLIEELSNDKLKLTFWINIYNATTQHALKNNPNYFQDRGSFYKKKLIVIAGKDYSLDEIEHGILRRNTSKYSLGYFRKWNTRKEIKRLMVKHIDPRIHFALNCGAKSCPPVLFFEGDKIDAQLDLTSKAYLEIECERNGDKLAVPALFSWFRGDFGGKKGIYRYLKKYGVLKMDEKPNLIYKNYDWTLSLENYQ